MCILLRRCFTCSPKFHFFSECSETMSPVDLWRFLPVGYLATVLIEAPFLIFGLSPRHSLRRKLFAAVWLNACSYPIVILVFPLIFRSSNAVYITVAEIFAPVSECALFWMAFGGRDESGRRSMWRDFIAITIANLASFLIGEVLNSHNWFGLYPGSWFLV